MAVGEWGTPYDSVPLAVTDAKKMCVIFLGIEHHVIDARDVFYDNVVDYFVKNMPMVARQILVYS